MRLARILPASVICAFLLIYQRLIMKKYLIMLKKNVKLHRLKPCNRFNRG